MTLTVRHSSWNHYGWSFASRMFVFSPMQSRFFRLLETGCGKSTQCPQFILDANPEANIAVTQREFCPISMSHQNDDLTPCLERSHCCPLFSHMYCQPDASLPSPLPNAWHKNSAWTELTPRWEAWSGIKSDWSRPRVKIHSWYF